jgi:tetratricopeptide (TPR) repeat protein
MIRAINNLGRVQRETGNLSEALKSHQVALNIADSLGDRVLQVNILNNIGTIQTHLGQLPPALAAFERAITINRMSNPSSDVATLINLAHYYVKASQLAKAEEYYHTAMAQHPNPRDWAGFMLIGSAD